MIIVLQVENFFCMGSPLAVFLALRGIRPGNTGDQDHIMPKSICRRLFNIFHPTDPVVRWRHYIHSGALLFIWGDWFMIYFSVWQAYRLEPLVLKHYSNIAPVQIHWWVFKCYCLSIVCTCQENFFACLCMNVTLYFLFF